MSISARYNNNPNVKRGLLAPVSTLSSVQYNEDRRQAAASMLDYVLYVQSELARVQRELEIHESDRRVRFNALIRTLESKENATRQCTHYAVPVSNCEYCS